MEPSEESEEEASEGQKHTSKASRQMKTFSQANILDNAHDAILGQTGKLSQSYKENVNLIEDEKLELMELAASNLGFPSIYSLDSKTLEQLDLFKDMLSEFPPESVHLKRPFAVQPWIDSEENVTNLLMVWKFLTTFADLLELRQFTLDELVQSLHDRAFAWKFDIHCSQRHLNFMTWPEILCQFGLLAGLGPNLKKCSADTSYSSSTNENGGLHN
ncbi:homeobox-DDT domain protein RLT1-like isoform X3 [Elaeis guineensis]|uniref:homeobox-DDT domain protein RLT1-like isoform X3 n=1 Tax=Elaeis guineensis var. tenera TaxID=51953 RepID=UPI003C6D3CC5